MSLINPEQLQTIQNTLNQSRIEKVRLSCNVQARMSVKIGGEDHMVLLVNKNRLGKDFAEYGFIGGACQFKDETCRRKVMTQFTINEEKLESPDNLDIRIRKLPAGDVVPIIKYIFNSDPVLADPKSSLLEELNQEMQGEMAVISARSMGVFSTDNFQGELPKEKELMLSTIIIPPVQTSGRTQEDSIKLQFVYDVAPPYPLQEFIIRHGTVYSPELAVINTPFMLIKENDLKSLAANGLSPGDDHSKLEHISFGNTSFPVGLSSAPVLMAGA